MLENTFDPYANKGRIALIRAFGAKEGRAMDMSKRYGEMLTKELVILRAKKKAAIDGLSQVGSRAALKEVGKLENHVEQINEELAGRVAQMGIFA